MKQKLDIIISYRREGAQLFRYSHIQYFGDFHSH